MTVIVGLIAHDKVYIGGDSCFSNEMSSCVTIGKQPKVFKLGISNHEVEIVERINDFIIIGCSGSMRVIQLIQFSFKPPYNKYVDFFEYLCTDFTLALRNLIKENNAFNLENGVEYIPAHLLIGYKNRLFVIQTDYNVVECIDKFTAIGSGSDFAKGAMGMNDKSTDDIKWTAESALKHTFDVCEYYCNEVRSPFIVLNT